MIVQDQIKQLNIRLKQSDSRSEYAEMNISKLHHRYNFFINGNVKQCKTNIVPPSIHNIPSLSGSTSWRTRSSGRSWRSTRSPASLTTPSTRCWTSTRRQHKLKIIHSTPAHQIKASNIWKHGLIPIQVYRSIVRNAVSFFCGLYLFYPRKVWKWQL